MPPMVARLLNVTKKFCMQARNILTNLSPNPARRTTLQWHRISISKLRNTGSSNLAHNDQRKLVDRSKFGLISLDDKKSTMVN